ncbi:hypothetical protein HN460_04040 [bacterium]|jgi:hypothetical protein|nr:hypothetical protein [bacterium]MBT3795226.1 hypothetical protein [bacterium]MBT4634457.1 hypothetical protein [bacterium]
MDRKIFPDVLENVSIDHSILYSENPSILYFSMNQLEIYLESYAFDNLIAAVSTCPQIYLEKGLDLNETFHKISPSEIDLSTEESKYVVDRIVSPASIAWTTQQYLLHLIQNTNNLKKQSELLHRKNLLESSLIQPARAVSKRKFEEFLYGVRKKRK